MKTNGVATSSENFRNWFGCSKAVNVLGHPLVVYHGSRYNADIRRFSVAKWEQDDDERGFYFTDSAEHADRYASQWGDAGPEDGGVIYSVYLRIENPYISDSLSWNMGSDISPAEARRRGYDGYVIENHEGGTTYVVFDPRQIKSATGNSGRFCPDSDGLTDSEHDDFEDFVDESWFRERMTA